MGETTKDQVVFQTEIGGWKLTFDLLKKYLKEHKGTATTITAALKRLSNIRDKNDFVYSTFSGGKDSMAGTVMFCFVEKLRRDVRNGILSIDDYNDLLGVDSSIDLIKKDIKGAMMVMDPEMCYSYTAYGYERMMKTFCGNYELGDKSWISDNKEENPYCYTKEELLEMTDEEISEIITGYGENEPLLNGFWCCFPIAWENMASLKDTRYWSFDSNKKDVWTRDLPKGNYVWNEENFFSFPLQYGLRPTKEDDVTIGQSDQELRTKFSKYMKLALNENLESEQNKLIDEIFEIEIPA